MCGGTGLLHSIGQANQNTVLSIASMAKHAIAKEVEGRTLGKFFKITCFDIRSEDIFKHIYLLWVILKLAVYILYLFIYNNIIIQPALLLVDIY